MAGGCRPHRGRVRIPRHGEDRARLGIRRGRPPLRVDGGRARRRSRVVRRLPRTLDGRTGLGPGPGGVGRRRGLDREGGRAMLGHPTIDPEALRRVYLLTKGCPLYLRAIREGDEETLRANSRFTKAEIRLLIYSGGAAR